MQAQRYVYSESAGQHTDSGTGTHTLDRHRLVCKITGLTPMCLEFNRLNIYIAVSGHRILDLLYVPFMISDTKVRHFQEVMVHASGWSCMSFNLFAHATTQISNIRDSF